MTCILLFHQALHFSVSLSPVLKITDALPASSIFVFILHSVYYLHITCVIKGEVTSNTLWFVFFIICLQSWVVLSNVPTLNLNPFFESTWHYLCLSNPNCLLIFASIKCFFYIKSKECLVFSQKALYKYDPMCLSCDFFEIRKSGKEDGIFRNILIFTTEDAVCIWDFHFSFSCFNGVL